MSNSSSSINSTDGADELGGDGLLRLIRGRYVSIIGQPASMTRKALGDLIELVGGVYNATGGDNVSLFIVGQKEWPLTRYGSLTGRLRREAIAIERYKRKSRIISEEQFLAAAGVLDELGPALHRLYTTAMVAEALDVSHARLRAWVKAGLVTPTQTDADGVCFFDFRQVTAAKTLSDMVRNGVSPNLVRRNLERLCKWMPADAGMALDQLSILERHGKVLFRLPDGDLAAADGQFYLDFQEPRPKQSLPTGSAAYDADPLALPVDYVPKTPMRIGPDVAGTAPCPAYAPPRDAAGWWDLGIRQEQAGHVSEAAESYRQALRHGGPDAQLCFDLAHALQAAGNRLQAFERYLQAVEVDPCHADAWNNLGLLLTEMEKRDEACQCFRQALEIHPDEMRATYNLADTLDEMGLHREAAAHWRAYLRRDMTSQWAEYARRRMAAWTG